MGTSSSLVPQMGFRFAVLKGVWRLTRRQWHSRLARGGTKESTSPQATGKHYKSPPATGKDGENCHETS
jgi:hypothetical protein